MTDPRCTYPGCAGPADGSECRHPDPEPDYVTLDAAGAPVYPCWIERHPDGTPATWNGWQQPHFTRPVMERFAADLAADTYTVTWEGDTVTIAYVDDEESAQTYEPDAFGNYDVTGYVWLTVDPSDAVPTDDPARFTDRRDAAELAHAAMTRYAAARTHRVTVPAPFNNPDDQERYSAAIAGGRAIRWCLNGHQMHDPVTVADTARRARATLDNLTRGPRAECTPWHRHPACTNYHPEPDELAAQLAQGRRPDPEPARCYTRLASPNAQHRCARPYHHSGPHSRHAED